MTASLRGLGLLKKIPLSPKGSAATSLAGSINQTLAHDPGAPTPAKARQERHAVAARAPCVSYATLGRPARDSEFSALRAAKTSSNAWIDKIETHGRHAIAPFGTMFI